MAAARAAWPTDAEAGVGGIAPERLVFLDECGVLTGMARLHGRSPRGTRARAGAARALDPAERAGRARPRGHAGRDERRGGHHGAVFHAYLEQVLLPELRRSKPDAVLVMDNLGAHKTPEGARAAGRLRLPLPLPAALLAPSLYGALRVKR